MTGTDNKSAALRNLASTEGWAYVESFMQERMEDSKNRLLTCELEEVAKHRARVEALQSVFIFIQKTIEEGRDGIEDIL